MTVRLRCTLAAGAAASALAAAPALAQSTAAYTYDSEGRVTTVTYPSGASTTYAYDNADNRTNLTTTVPGGAAPLAAAQTASVSPSGSVSIPVLQSASDPSNRPLSIVSVSTPGKGTAAIAGDKVVYTSTGASGVDTFTYTIANDRGARTSAQITVTIADACTPPSAQASSATVAFGSISNSIPLILAGGAATSLVLTGAPTHGTASVNGLAISYTPAIGYSGPDSFSYKALNACGAGPASVNLLVQTAPTQATQSVAAQAASAPTTQSLDFTIAYDNAATLNLAPGGQWTTVALAGAPSHGAAVIRNGSAVTYTPISGYVGKDSFTYVATGPGGTSSPGLVTVTVAAPAAPTASPLTLSAPFETAAGIKLAPGGVWTSVTVFTQPAHGSLALDGASATYTPDPAYVGGDSFAYVAVGPGGKSAPARVDIVVQPASGAVAAEGN